MRWLGLINLTGENLQIAKHKSGRRSFSSADWFVLCDLQIFSGKVYHPEPPHAQSLFLFPIVYGINFHSAEGIYVRKARVVIQQMTDRRGVFFSFRVTPPLWGCGAPLAILGGLPFLKKFSLLMNQSERVYFYWPPRPNPVVTMSTRVGPGSRLQSGPTARVSYIGWWFQARLGGLSLMLVV